MRGSVLRLRWSEVPTMNEGVEWVQMEQMKGSLCAQAELGPANIKKLQDRNAAVQLVALELFERFCDRS